MKTPFTKEALEIFSNLGLDRKQVKNLIARTVPVGCPARPKIEIGVERLCGRCNTIEATCYTFNPLAKNGSCLNCPFNPHNHDIPDKRGFVLPSKD